jgi:hypothetical protein
MKCTFLEQFHSYLEGYHLVERCRCRLAEEIAHRLPSDDAEARVLAAVFRAPSSSEDLGSTFGPDFVPITPGLCTEKRCERRCVRAFERLLQDHGVECDSPT